MQDNFIQACVKRGNRNLFITTIIIFMIMVITLIVSSKYLYNTVAGPFEFGKDKILSIKDVGELKEYYVSVSPEESFDTGISYIVEKYDETSKKVQSTTYESDYHILWFDEKAIIAKVPHGKAAGGKYTGELVELPEDVKYEILKIAKEQGYPEEDFNSLLVPVLLKEGNFKLVGYIEIVVCSILFLIVMLNMIKIMKRKVDIYSHPIYKKFAFLGDVDTVEREINSSFEGSNKLVFGSVVITDTWMALKRTYTTQFIRTDDIMWLYKKVTKHSYNMIPTGKTYEIAICLSNKTCEVIKLKEAYIDRIIDTFHQKSPWVFLGYSDEVLNMWRSQFDVFKAEVDMQKRRHMERETVGNSGQYND